MIGYIKGKVLCKKPKFVILEASGVGYKIYGTFGALESSSLGDEKVFWIYHAVREDTSDLYGFEKEDELDFFELLISISGIGPRTALGILNVTTVSALKRAVSSGDISHLVKVSGIGKKNAEKIVLELKDKFKQDDEEGTGYKEEVDALDALKSLGFGHSEAREALKQVANATSTSERVKRALKILGR